VTGAPAAITLRAVCPADEPFLFELYASAREFEMAQVPWTPAQKQAFLEMQFAAQTRSYAAANPDATHEVILREGEAAGRLYLARRPDRLHILDITIAPSLRNAGIGSAVLQGILEEADRAGKAVSIFVETFNPSMRFFERLRFQPTSIDGFLVLLERPPAGTAPVKDPGDAPGDCAGG